MEFDLDGVRTLHTSHLSGSKGMSPVKYPSWLSVSLPHSSKLHLLHSDDQIWPLASHSSRKEEKKGGNVLMTLRSHSEESFPL